jgi:predicted GNAT superfamily acetyltransferase
VATVETAGSQAVTADKIAVRPCESLDELQAAVRLQKEVWNFSDADLVPMRLYVVAQKIGGQVIGAFDDNELIGFALSIPGTRAGRPYLHSHMLAVREKYRNLKIGQRLKFAQREDALSRGFELIEWTFDPLEIKNAFLNLEKLGAIARRYNINQYGITSSPLQGGLPTDRLVAEWWLRSKRVETVVKTGKHPRIKLKRVIQVPAQIYNWKSDPDQRSKALQVQTANREEFLRAFADGLAVLGYETDAQGNGRFLLARWDEDWSYSSAEPT